MRKDRYEKDLIWYWVEESITGTFEQAQSDEVEDEHRFNAEGTNVHFNTDMLDCPGGPPPQPDGEGLPGHAAEEQPLVQDSTRRTFMNMP